MQTYIYEPKCRNRWTAKFPEAFDIQELFIHETSRPRFVLNGNGDLICDPIEFTFYDPVGPSIAQKLFKLIESPETLYDVEKGFTYHLSMLDPTGVEVERWEMSECKILSVEFGDLNHADDKFVTPKLKIHPGKAKLLY